MTLFNALVIGAILLALGLSLYLLLREALLSNVENTARGRAVAAAKAVEPEGALLGDDEERLTTDGVFLLVRDASGEILDRSANVSIKKKARGRVWKRTLASGDLGGGMAKLTSEEPDYVYAVSVDPPNGPARAVEAGKAYESVRETLEVFGTDS